MTATGTIVHYAVKSTTLGPVLIAGSDDAIRCVAFREGRGELEARFPGSIIVEGNERFDALAERVVAAIEEPRATHDIPLDTRGTAFRETVWRELKAIPPGETRSYRDIAAAIGNPKATRAVGGANGANMIAVLIPCHRVIAADGSQGGYAYGDEIKRELLRRERQVMEAN
ncbi:MAG: methylated-DNA--[protein]-cysteine S-methyltransferase [Pontixanthobacter sp.]